jgi:hypothetical protein
LLNKVGYERSGTLAEFIEHVVDFKSIACANIIIQELNSLQEIVGLFKTNDCLLVWLNKFF